jgi:hypothetical protein
MILERLFCVKVKKETSEVLETSEVWCYTQVRRRIQRYIKNGVTSISPRVA